MFVCNSVTRWWSKRWKSVEVVSVPFICEKNFTFFCRVLSMDLTSTTSTSQFFRAFFALFGGSRWRSPCVRGVDGIERYDTLRQSFTNLSIERKFYFFLLCVKTVFECHRVSYPSFSGFLRFLMMVGWRSPAYSPASHSQLYSSSRCKSYGVS